MMLLTLYTEHFRRPEMKDFIKFIKTILITAILSLIILCISSKIFLPKWIDHRMNMMTFIMRGFYQEEKNSLDVIFVGNSDTYRGIDPLVMYHEYGFTSYNYVAAGQRIWTGYAMFEESLKYQEPKIILFNVDELFFTKQTSYGNSSKVYDNMKFSINKIKSVYDSNYKRSRIVKLAHFLPIFRYHSRYNELTSDDFKYAFYNSRYALKGMDMVAYQEPYTGNKNYMKDKNEEIELPEVSIYYLDKMYDECQKRNISFVLYHVPSPDSSSYAKYKAVKEYADSKDITYLELNFDNDKIGIDWNEDTSDGGDHLNMFGAVKVSTYLGKYLVDNYDLPDHRNDSKYDYWNDDYEEYLKIREQEIIDAKELSSK